MTTTKTIGGAATPVDIVRSQVTETVAAGTSPANYLTTYLVDGGSNDMGVNGAITPVSFAFEPPPDKIFLAARILLYMESGANFDSTNFMHLPALANGLQINAAGITLTNWQDNIDVILDMFDLASAGVTFGNERRNLTGRWTFTRATVQSPLIINSGEMFEALVRDDLSAAGIIFRMKIQGKLIDV